MYPGHVRRRQAVGLRLSRRSEDARSPDSLTIDSALQWMHLASLKARFVEPQIEDLTVVLSLAHG